ncbi:hypothetical protein Ctob_005051 [Chrysochromulina tobinii]|uniref:Uncharacterized protein n=1 Tax=Chrysochromulina tobinii TaxID=1460289 RepID=A0A0M0JRS4_9EUKA|nr:hypothetical protein Ctob_005051 [Chrysochromulina tobinii]|eukprot:KOO29311.1 hypothetical protein Ctob_005051 [Chrysochromulina sp. CCMP291]
MAHVHEANVGYRQPQAGFHQRQLEAPLLMSGALGIHEHAHVHVRMQSFGKLGLHRRDRVRIGEFGRIRELHVGVLCKQQNRVHWLCVCWCVPPLSVVVGVGPLDGGVRQCGEQKSGR